MGETQSEERASPWVPVQTKIFSPKGARQGSESQKVRAYIATQEQHHRKVSFQDEFRSLCRKHGIEIDERYVWD